MTKRYRIKREWWGDNPQPSGHILASENGFVELSNYDGWWTMDEVEEVLDPQQTTDNKITIQDDNWPDPPFEAINVGKKSDQGKRRWDLVDFNSLDQIVDGLTYGSKKYGDRNYLLVENARERYFAALMRHLVAWRGGETHDSESQLHHLAHVGVNVLFLLTLDAKETK